MAQEQPRRPPESEQDPVKYGDVFTVSVGLANKPIAPQDAAATQSAETQMLGKTQKGGPAAVMQSAASKNVEAGVLPPGAVTDVVRNEGVTVTKSEVDGTSIINESVGDEVVGQYAEPAPPPVLSPEAAAAGDAITIGEALEATALSAGNKPVDQSDAAAIQAAEMRAIGSNETPPGGVGAEAQSAAAWNALSMSPEDKTSIADVLGDATAKLSDDKVATTRDAKDVIAVEIRNNPEMATALGGVGESVATAARLNQSRYG
ncbi:hypothetical protein Ancab_020035 [Ancistrocladus abbreviatus]